MNRITLLNTLSSEATPDRLGVLSVLNTQNVDRIESLKDMCNQQKNRINFVMKIADNTKMRYRVQVFKAIFNLEVFNKKRIGVKDE